MIQKEITICGKQVKLAYCYATEIGFKLLCDQDINEFILEVGESLNSQPQILPDVRKSIMLIIAAANAYYERTKEESPLKDTDMMYEMSPVELGMAIGTVLNMRGEFYKVPGDEPQEKEEPAKKGKKKNA